MMTEPMTPDEAGHSENRPVVKCVCFDVTFTAMKEYARSHQCGVEGLTERFGCGRSCALCLPYIRLMLRTGRTRFAVNEPDAGSQP